MQKLFDHPLPFFAAVALTTAALAFGVMDVVRTATQPMTAAAPASDRAVLPGR